MNSWILILSIVLIDVHACSSGSCHTCSATECATETGCEYSSGCCIPYCSGGCSTCYTADTCTSLSPNCVWNDSSLCYDYTACYFPTVSKYDPVVPVSNSFEIYFNNSRTTDGNQGYSTFAVIDSSYTTPLLKPDVPDTTYGVTTTLTIENKNCTTVEVVWTLVNNGASSSTVGICMYGDANIRNDDSVNWQLLPFHQGLKTVLHNFYIQAEEPFTGVYAGSYYNCYSTQAQVYNGGDSWTTVNYQGVDVAAGATKEFRVFFSTEQAWNGTCASGSSSCASCDGSQACYTKDSLDCFWNGTICTNISTCLDGTSCSSCPHDSACNAQYPTCDWNYTSRTCMNIACADTISCSSCSYPATCYGQSYPTCAWDYVSETCINNTCTDPTSCSSCPYYSTCNALTDCRWSYSSDSCINTTCTDPNSCSSCPYDTTCSALPGSCEWTYYSTSPSCINITTTCEESECTSCQTQSACTALSLTDCSWDNINSLCFNTSSYCSGTFCSTCNSENSCVYFSTDCNWNGTSCFNRTTDCGGTACSTCYENIPCNSLNPPSPDPPQCIWNSYQCNDISSYCATSSCSSCNSEPSCTAWDPVRCAWNVTSSSCYDMSSHCYSTTCDSCVSYSSCTSLSGCSWDWDNGVCANISCTGSTCATCGSSTSCTGLPLCNWEGLSCYNTSSCSQPTVRRYVPVPIYSSSFDILFNDQSTTGSYYQYYTTSVGISYSTSTLRPDTVYYIYSVQATLTVTNVSCNTVAVEYSLVNTGSSAVTARICLYGDTALEGNTNVNWGLLPNNHGLYTQTTPALYVQAEEPFSGVWAGSVGSVPTNTLCTSYSSPIPATGVDSGINVNWQGVTIPAYATRTLRLTFSTIAETYAPGSCPENTCASRDTAAWCGLSSSCVWSGTECYSTSGGGGGSCPDGTCSSCSTYASCRGLDSSTCYWDGSSCFDRSSYCASSACSTCNSEPSCTASSSACTWTWGECRSSSTLNCWEGSPCSFCGNSPAECHSQSSLCYYNESACRNASQTFSCLTSDSCKTCLSESECGAVTTAVCIWDSSAYTCNAPAKSESSPKKGLAGWQWFMIIFFPILLIIIIVSIIIICIVYRRKKKKAVNVDDSQDAKDSQKPEELLQLPQQPAAPVPAPAPAQGPAEYASTGTGATAAAGSEDNVIYPAGLEHLSTEARDVDNASDAAAPAGLDGVAKGSD